MGTGDINGNGNAGTWAPPPLINSNRAKMRVERAKAGSLSGATTLPVIRGGNTITK